MAGRICFVLGLTFLSLYIGGLALGSTGSPQPQSAAEGKPAQAHSETVAKIPIMVTALQSKGAVSEELLAVYTGVIAGRLDELEIFQVITTEDVKHLIKHDRLVTALNSDDVSKLSDIGKAVGTPYLVTGTAAKAGEAFVFSLGLFEMEKTAFVSRETLSVTTNPSTLVAELRYRVDKLTLPLRTSKSGLFVVRSSEEGATIYLDDQAVGATPMLAMSVASGPHRVSANKPGFVKTSADVVIQPEGTKAVDLVLVPAQDYLEEYRQAAWTYRIASLALMGAGAATAIAGGGVWGGYLFREQQIAEETNQHTTGGPLKLRTSHYNELNTLRLAGGGLMIAAVPIVGAGVVVFVLGDPPERYDGLVE